MIFHSVRFAVFICEVDAYFSTSIYYNSENVLPYHHNESSLSTTKVTFSTH